MTHENPPQPKKDPNEILDSIDWLKVDASSEHSVENTTPKSLGHRAVDSVVQLVPTEKISALYHSEPAQKAIGVARGAATEVAMASVTGAGKALGERLGVSYEDGAVRIRKAKLAAAAVRIARAPYAELALTAKSVGKEAYKSGKREARRQAISTSRTAANRAVGYLENQRRVA